MKPTETIYARIKRNGVLERVAWAVLGALQRCDGHANRYELAYESGHNRVYVHYGAVYLIQHGLAIKSYPTRLTMTERGKIALAIYSGKMVRRSIPAKQLIDDNRRRRTNHELPARTARCAP